MLAVYCAGGLGREVMEFARTLARWDRYIFVDDATDATEVNGAQVFRWEDVAKFDEPVEFVIALGEPEGRDILYKKIKAAGYSLPTLISPYCSYALGTTMGEGCIIYESRISVSVHIAENSYVSTLAIIGHDVTIGRSCVISANVFLGGKAEIADAVYIAPCSIVRENAKVGHHAIVSLGSVVHRNVKPESIVLGNPGKVIGQNTEHKVFGIFA